MWSSDRRAALMWPNVARRRPPGLWTRLGRGALAGGLGLVIAGLAWIFRGIVL